MAVEFTRTTYPETWHDRPRLAVVYKQVCLLWKPRGCWTLEWNAGKLNACFGIRLQNNLGWNLCVNNVTASKGRVSGPPRTHQQPVITHDAITVITNPGMIIPLHITNYLMHYQHSYWHYLRWFSVVCWVGHEVISCGLLGGTWGDFLWFVRWDMRWFPVVC